ncbi:MAG TPA: chemotaxis protein CheW [Geobacteraceae bacterium]
MNLAEIRKKANKDKAGSPAPVVTEEEKLAPAFEVDEQAPAELQEWTIPDEEESALPVEQPSWTASSVPSTYDPLALIMAGREGAFDEEAVAADTEAEGVSSASEVFNELLCFRVSSEKYAINILEIKEIIKPREITEVPRVPAFVSGVLSLRGIIIPIYNLRKRLGLAPLQESHKERIIVIKRGEEFRGILVDEVIQVVRIAASSIEQPPAVLDGIDREFVSGIGRHDDMMLILLNLEKILDVNLL